MVEEKRCPWPKEDYYIKYHDEEWGRPQHNDQKLFEFLVLEGMQAGLSWSTILKKRNYFLQAFDDFEIEKVAGYDDDKFQELMNNSNIIRNRLKIRSAITNANLVIQLQKEFGSLDHYLWRYVNFKPIKNQFETIEEVPANTVLSDQISKDLKKRGFKFVGTTIIYSYMQAIGIVNDHLVWCKQYHECNQLVENL